jgi:hypothetical protein
MAAERDYVLGTHEEELARLGQIDVGNAFIRNAVAVLSLVALAQILTPV